MKNWFFFFICSIFFVSSFGQFVSGNGVLEGLYGVSYLTQEENFVNTIETEHDVQFNSTSNYWGFGLSSTFNITRGAYMYDGDLIYYQFIKQKQTALNGDEHEFYGSFFSIFAGGGDLISNRNIDLMIQFGFNLGNRKYRYTQSKGEQSLYKNFIFAPKAKLELRFILGALSISGKLEGQYDVSKPVWKNKKGPDQIELDDLKLHGYLMSFGLGWAFD